ncbi:MAG: dephospho-CoA kinase [Eubacteriales bacterium]|nr:dephospho-CoA kinase [Eubacteriales bacterium]
MKIIGLTGGVGAGKSTVLEFLQKDWDAFVLQADQVGHLVMEPGRECYEPIIRLFGEEIIKKDKTIDRRRVSDVVFSQREKLEALNKIVHPAVRRYILETLEKERKSGRKLCVVEAALLLEEQYDKFCDAVWYVHTDRKIRISRLMENRGYTKEKAENIIRSQKSEDFFFSHADFVIENNGSPEEARLRLAEGIQQL